MTTPSSFYASVGNKKKRLAVNMYTRKRKFCLILSYIWLIASILPPTWCITVGSFRAGQGLIRVHVLLGIMAPAFDVFLDHLMLLQVIVFMWGGIVTHVSFVLAGLGCVSGLLKSVSSLFLQESGKKAKDNLSFQVSLCLFSLKNRWLGWLNLLQK